MVLEVLVSVSHFAGMYLFSICIIVLDLTKSIVNN